MNNQPEARSLSEHLEHDIDDAGIERLWAGIEARRRASLGGEFSRSRGKWRGFFVGGGLAVAAGVLLGWFFFAPGGSATKSDGSALVASAAPQSLKAGGAALWTGGEQIAVDLKDGSKVTLKPHSRVSLQESHSDDVGLVLHEGRASCDVAKDQDRLFSVQAGPVSVTVVGTRFSVTRLSNQEGEEVRVEVEEGIVAVSAPHQGSKRLFAGESWAIKLPHPQLAKESDNGSASTTPGDKSAEASDPGTVKRQAAPKTAEQVEEAARDLFQEARAKRTAGEAEAAAHLYQQFLREFGSDGRAGVAALELGRIRMDQLGDVAGAIAPLKLAARQGAGGLGDDALARLTQAYAMLGQTSECQRVRARYLEGYPRGVHVEQVRSLCP